MVDHIKEPERMAWRKAHDDGADINGRLIIHLRDLSHRMRAMYEGKGSHTASL